MMNYSLPPLMALPAILEAVDGKIPVFVDCGFESGMDVYKALALGAKAVSVGRHLMPFLKDGAEAVAGRIREMDAELRGVMARTGVGSLQEMDPTVLHKTIYP
nr:alpha-hydroxy-acid oxidizing protein [Lachnospiraceae bacterium]